MDTSLPQRASAPPLPEVDPELAAMEAEMGNKERVSVGAEILQRVLAGLRKDKGGVKSTGLPAGQTYTRDKRRAERSPGRRSRRAILQAQGEIGGHRADARLGRSKPVKSARQQAWEFKSAVRAELSRIKVSMLIGECPEAKYVVGVPGIKNVWQLSQADTATIHAIPGFGPKRRAALRNYLLGRQVPVVWAA